MKSFCLQYLLLTIQQFQMQVLFDMGMATGPVLGYILQYRLILKNKSVGAFSIDICLVLLIANILRLNFYLFQTYQLALFFQSIFMIIAQLLLLRVCCEYREQSTQSRSQDIEKDDIFWRWSSFTPYWQFTLGFAIGSFFVCVIMWALEFQAFGELVGLVALLTESVLILPQIVDIYKSCQVEGISYWLIALNLVGDTFKTIYFYYKDQPFQFKLCGIIQLVLDVVVISQIAYYRLKQQITKLEEQAGNQGKTKGETVKPYKQGENNQDLEGSLSQTIVIEEALENIDAKTETQTQTCNNL